MTTPKDQARDDQLAYGGVGPMCQAIGISRALYYKLPPQDRPPHFMLGKKPVFPVASTRQWLEQQMAKAVAAAA